MKKQKKPVFYEIDIVPGKEQKTITEAFQEAVTVEHLNFKDLEKVFKVLKKAGY